ncbi:tyrosine--tRNA ligase [soil metagenome]
MPASPTPDELTEFLSRAVSEVFVREDLERLLASGERRLRIKQGFDPTRPNLHIGHTVSLRKLRTLARWGHEIVIIVGDWTTQIGDPTDKDETRPMMSHEDVLNNARTYLDQFHRIVPRENTRIVSQSEWYASFGLRQVFELASRFSAQQLLAREEFKRRQTAGVPIPVKDLLYPLLQAYDSVAIEADVEVGGTDQQFNLLAGRQLQERLGMRPQNVFVTHLLEGLDGERMSKTKPSTAIWITDPPDEMFGKVMSLHDDLMPHYYEWATDLPLAEVRSIGAALARGELHPRDAKERLSRQVVGELHSPEAAAAAADAFARRFRRRERPAVEPTILERHGEHECGVLDLILRLSLAKSASEARRLLSQGAVRVDEQKATLETRVRMEGKTFLQVGPRTVRQISWR